MGKFIVFEGGHGSGKTTLTSKLSEYLINQGKKVTLTKEPFNQEIKETIETLSVNEEKLDKNLAILYLLTADRFLHTRYIQERLRNNNFIISDRYVLSSFVYQQMQNIPIQMIREANSFCTIPDLTFFVDTPHKEREKRSENRNKPDSFFRKRYKKEDALYIKICKRFSKEYNIVHIDGSKILTDVTSDIIRITSKKFL